MRTVEVRLKIPEDLSYQLVYRQKRQRAFLVEERADTRFFLLSGVRQALTLLSVLREAFGTMGAAKCAAKLITWNRMLYGIIRDGRIVHHGWATVSFCRYYRVEPGDVVIGPILTLPEWRGKGFAAAALQQAMNTLMQKGHSVFFIDTSGDNLVAQRVIAKCGFGAPVASYIRGRVRQA